MRVGSLARDMVAALVLIGAVIPGSAVERPNILFILADDLGWSDLGCYGQTRFRTPHLDRLAGEGLRLTRAYAPAPICSASRASFLTGKTPARLGFEFVTKSKPGGQSLAAPLRTPPFALDLPLAETTIAEALGTAGYRTAFFGKWHLNRHHRRYLGWSPTHGPQAQGFEVATEDFGSHPYAYWSRRSQRGPLDVGEGVFPEDSMTQRAVGFLRSRHRRPFFPETGFAQALKDIGVDDGVPSQSRPQSALRSGPWKLVHFYEGDRDELYHLPSDPAEQNDRAGSEPAVATRLRRTMTAALRSCGARLPKPNPDWSN